MKTVIKQQRKNKKSKGIITTIPVITELNKTKDKLQKSQELINSVFHTTDIGIAIFDEKGKYLKTNDGYDKLLGYGPGELEGKPFTITAPPGHKKDSHDRLIQLLSGDNGSGERLFIRKNGELIYVFRTARLLHNPDGSKYLLVTVRDITETKKYRNLLQDTERIAGVAGWELDLPSGKITRTDELYNILEISQNKLDKLTPEKRMETLYDAESLPMIRKAYHEAIQKGKPFDLELGIITGTGKRKWVRVTCSTERIKSKTIKLNGTLQDITRQKETALELERLSLVASKTNNAVFIMDKIGKTVWVNKSVERMTGYSESELIGKTPGELLQGKDTDAGVIDRMSKKLEKHLPVSGIIKNYRKDGSVFWVNLDIAPVFKNNRIENFIAIGIDITELIHAREAEKDKVVLEQQQKLFNSIAKNFPDGIIGVLDKNLQYVFVGGSEIKKLGLTPETFIGARIFDHLSDKSNSTSEPYLKRAVAGEPVVFETEMLGQIYSVNAVPLPGDDGMRNEVLIVLYNVTEQKRSEENVKKALIQQMELNELKSKFVAIASHEFRTPLSTILSSTFLISKYIQSQDTAKSEKHIERIEMAVHTLTDILNDFLSLGRIEDGKVENNIVEFDVTDFCDSLKEELQPNLKKGQSIIYRHTGEKDSFLLDRRHLRNVLVNLLSNASKYSGEGAIIWLNSVIKNGQLEFSIRDEGIGIPASDQPRLFQTFFRANNAIHIQGTGMGLHIVKRFLDIMGGTIHFTSEENKGSTFVIQFPSRRY